MQGRERWEGNVKRVDRSRREFLKTALGGAVGLTLLSGRGRSFSPNERIVVGHVGVGGMGNSHVKWFAGMKDVDIAAICDVDRSHLADTMAQLKERRPDCRVKGYTDFRRLIERKDIDVITCATPDHWHALVAIHAFDAGKDVYGEKPLSHNLAEGQAMLRAMEKNQRLFQLGTQIHAGDNYHRVVELVRSGALGKIEKVTIWKEMGPSDIGYPVQQPVPAGLDWDLWLGPAPYTEYNPKRCHFTFRYFLDYSGGTYADFWCHIADIVFWALEPTGLKSVEARGERAWDSASDAPAWLEADFEFENLTLHWRPSIPDLPGAEGKGIGACFHGSKGSLICDYGSRQIRLGKEVIQDLPDVPQCVPRSPGHQRNFLDCVKNRNLPESHLAYARQMTLPMHLGLVSWRLRRKIFWDCHQERCIGDEMANRLLSRPGRTPWMLG